MRGGGRVRLALAACAAVALTPAPAAWAKARRPAPPLRGWVVDGARFENLDAGGFVTVAGTGDVRGVVDVVPGAGGVAVVNELGLDDYLQGVAEVPATWPVEALRAQAIAARTYAAYTLAADKDTAATAVGGQICATESCQVYAGVAKERQDGGARWVDAVRSTAGQVLLFKGAPILAMYSSSNGGQSVPGSRPYLRAAKDPDSARGPYGHWAVSFSYAQLGTLFGAPGPVTAVRRVGDAVTLDWGTPGASAGQVVVPVAAFRDRMNSSVPPQGDLPRPVPSVQFTVNGDDQAHTATLDGRGNGHGIGLSQFGALGKAVRGMRAADILAAYYGGIRPAVAPPGSLPDSIRVALDTGAAAATVGGTGHFRVLDRGGAPLAVSATGQWRVIPAGRGKVRVIPPADQEAAPAVEVVDVGAGQARVRLGSAALVRVRVEGGRLTAPAETTSTAAGPGEATVALPRLPGPGRFTVSVVADRGAGRVTTAAAPLVVRRVLPASQVVTASAEAPAGLPRPAALATGLLLAVGAGLGRVLVQRPVPAHRMQRAAHHRPAHRRHR